MTTRVGFIKGHQHGLGVDQVAVVDLRRDAQDVAHERVDVDCLEGLHHQVPAERRPNGPEEGLHVHLVVVVAVLALVGLHPEVLRETRRRCGIRETRERDRQSQTMGHCGTDPAALENSNGTQHMVAQQNKTWFRTNINSIQI